MFEKAKLSAIPSAHPAIVQDVTVIDQFTDRSNAASDPAEAIPLRTIEWSELTARLSAARDLRQLLRADTQAKVGPDGFGFADAAAQFFRASEEDERCVNPNALEARKSSSGTDQNVNCARPYEGSYAADESSENSSPARFIPSDTKEEQ